MVHPIIYRRGIPAQSGRCIANGTRARDALSALGASERDFERANTERG